MGNADGKRWRQRLESFAAAMARLDDACVQDAYTDLERAGLVQTFVFSHELAWKTLKDLLFYEGYDANSPRRTVRQAFEAGYLGEEDCETFLDAIDKRNLSSRACREDVAREAEDLIKRRYRPMLARLRDALRAREGAP